MSRGDPEPSDLRTYPGWLLNQIASIGTWIFVGLPTVMLWHERDVVGQFWFWLACYLAFGILLILTVMPRYDAYLRHDTLIPLTLMTLLALGTMQFSRDPIGGVLLILTASIAPHVLPKRQATIWVVSQTLLMGLLMLQFRNVTDTVIQTALYFSFQIFSLLTTQISLSEALAKERLAQVNAELRATQELLAESSRMSERVRISRELHDVIGHRLTALSLNLEVASHVTEGKALTHVQTSQELAKALLSEVRGVVSSMREPLVLDIAGALRLLTRDIPTPAIHLSVASDLCIDDPQRAQVLLRCAQEIITNAVKHAGADNLWLNVERKGPGITLTARDDGRGAPLFRGGNGLTGMKERLEALGGRLELAPNPGRGFALMAVVPA